MSVALADPPFRGNTVPSLGDGNTPHATVDEQNDGLISRCARISPSSTRKSRRFGPFCVLRNGVLAVFVYKKTWVLGENAGPGCFLVGFFLG